MPQRMRTNVSQAKNPQRQQPYCSGFRAGCTDLAPAQPSARAAFRQAPPAGEARHNATSATAAAACSTNLERGDHRQLYGADLRARPLLRGRPIAAGRAPFSRQVGAHHSSWNPRR